MATPLVSPIFYAWHPDTGLPLAGGQVFTYISGTTTPKSSYMDVGAVVENANPVILNDAGYAPIFLEGSYRIVIRDADGVQLYAFDDVSDLTPKVESEWVLPTNASYLSPTSFRVAGDMTATFTAGRALRLVDVGAFVAYVESSAYSGGTTTVSFYGSGTITAALSIVSVGLISVAPISTLSTGIAICGGRSTAIRGSALYAVNGAVGGTPDYLDGIDGLTGGPAVNGQPTPLQTGDLGVVADPDGDSVTVFVMDAEDGGSVDGEDVIAPSLNGGLKRWKRKEAYFSEARVMDNIYPVGRIISTYTSTNPSVSRGAGGMGYPGTWELWGAGCTPICVNSADELLSTAGNTGGSKDAVLVEHNHAATSEVTDNGHTHTYTRTPRAQNCNNENDATGTGSEYSSDTGKAFTGITVTTTNVAAGVSGTNANLQPYICEYRWRRTA